MEKVVNLPIDQFVNFALEKQFSEKQMEMLREMRFKSYSEVYIFISSLQEERKKFDGCKILSKEETFRSRGELDF